MIKFIPYQPEHFDQIKLRQSFEATASVLATPNGFNAAKAFTDMGQAVTIVDDAVILAVVTWYSSRAGVLDIGMFASEEINSRAREYLRFAKTNFVLFLSMIKDDNIRRIQTLSYAEAKHDVWMKWLGFTCEGTLKKFACDGSDMRIWAITEVPHG